MNDFTKDELEDLRDAVILTGKPIELFEKIQEMMFDTYDKNDFTKDELDTILAWSDVYTEFGQSWTFESNKQLINKIKSMVDNYCENDVAWCIKTFTKEEFSQMFPDVDKDE